MKSGNGIAAEILEIWKNACANLLTLFWLKTVMSNIGRSMLTSSKVVPAGHQYLHDIAEIIEDEIHCR